MAVRLDIRPRLTLRETSVAKKAWRPRLPPLALPAAAYWVAMGGLTYVFAHWGEHPLEIAAAAELPPPPPRVEAPAPPPVARVVEPEARPATVTAYDPAEDATVTESPVAEERNSSVEPAELGRDRDRERGKDRDRNRDRDRESVADAVDWSQVGVSERKAEPQARLTFPEFTDTSRPAHREHAGDGPRIDANLFTPREEPPPPSAPAPDAPPPSDANAPAVSSSCEAAIARNSEELRIGGPRGPADITRGAYASILENGRYLSGCSLPDRTVLEICAAVKNGRSVGITVTSNPASPALNACVRRAVSRLRFPSNDRLDVTHTRFDAVRR